MSRLKYMRWSCVPAWLTEFCLLNGLSVEHAAVAGATISYSLHKREPIAPNYQSLWACIKTTMAFEAPSVEYLKGLLMDLMALGVLFEVEGGKVMPGPVAMPFEKEHIIYSFWEPLENHLAVEALISATNQGIEP